MKKKILITGTNGFIGKNLALHFSQEKYGDDYELICPKRQECDLLDAKQVRKLLYSTRPEIVIHSAIQSTLGYDELVKSKELENNLKMFFNLERCTDFFGKMYYFGSGAEYGAEGYEPLMNESSFGATVPKDQYGFSKYIMAKQALQHDNIYNLRLFGVFGPYENYNYRFISNAICKALAEKDILIRRNVKFDYLYICDLCNIMGWFLENEPIHRQYNLCTSKPMEIFSIANMIKDKVGTNIKIEVANSGLGKEYTGDNSRLLKELGQVSFTRTESSVEQLIEFYKVQGFNLEGDY